MQQFFFIDSGSKERNKGVEEEAQRNSKVIAVYGKQNESNGSNCFYHKKKKLSEIRKKVNAQCDSAKEQLSEVIELPTFQALEERIQKCNFFHRIRHVIITKPVKKLNS